MVKLILTDEHRAEILNAPESETTADLARRLGTPYSTTYAVRAVIRRGEWSCQLSASTCDTCGEVLLVPPHAHGMRRHKSCKVEHNRQRQQRLREEDEEFRDAVYARARQRKNDLQRVTIGLDVRSYQRWDHEDDAYLWEHRHEVYTPDGAERLAGALGRTFAACQRRLTRLDEAKKLSHTVAISTGYRVDLPKNCRYTDEMITVSRLIAQHAPTEGRQPLIGNAVGTCYICSLPTEHGQRRAPSAAFTAWASCGSGDVLCPDCAATLNWRDVRMFSWLAAPDGVRFEGRGDRGWLWDVFAAPPDPPYAVYVTKSGQKQGWISGVRQIATAQSIPVMTDWTDRPVMLRQSDWDAMAPLILSLRERGLSRNALNGAMTPSQWRAAIREGYDGEVRRAHQYIGDPRWEVLVHVSNDPNKPAGSAGARSAPGAGL